MNTTEEARLSYCSPTKELLQSRRCGPFNLTKGLSQRAQLSIMALDGGSLGGDGGGAGGVRRVSGSWVWNFGRFLSGGAVQQMRVQNAWFGKIAGFGFCVV